MCTCVCVCVCRCAECKSSQTWRWRVWGWRDLGLVCRKGEVAWVLGAQPRAAMSSHPGGTKIWLWTGTSPVRFSLPAPLRLHFPQHLLMIKVPVVYNYQFDKFRSSLLIIIISFHSVRLQEFNNNINNRRMTIRNWLQRIDWKDFLLLSGKLINGGATCTAAPSVCLNSVIGSKSALGNWKQQLWPRLANPKFKINQGRKKQQLNWQLWAIPWPEIKQRQ